jgi:hypothetical protein
VLTLPDFFRSAPTVSVQSYLLARGIEPPGIPWRAHPRVWSPKLQEFLDSLPDDQQESLIDEIQRIIRSADAEGQAAMRAALDAPSRAILDGQENGFARAIWLMLEQPAMFERAEQIRDADSLRNGRMWRAYATDAWCSVNTSATAVESFKAAVREELGTRNVEIDICSRTQAKLTREVALTQVSVFFEGQSESRKAFVKDKLDRVTDCPVVDAALTYEAATGRIEVVNRQSDAREALVRLLALHLLGSPIPGKPVQVRQYTIDKLTRRQEFQHDPEDAIEGVRVNRLRLIANDGSAEQVTIQCPRSAGRDIWQMAESRFGDRDPLRSGFTVSQVHLTVRFKTSIGRGQRSLPVTISGFSSCDLKEHSNRQRLIGEKYLERWGLVRAVQ